MRKIYVFAILIITILLPHAYAQTSNEEAVKAYLDARKTYSDATLELQRIDLRSQKRTLIQKAVPLTEEQTKNFWPIYDKYEKRAD